MAKEKIQPDLSLFIEITDISEEMAEKINKSRLPRVEANYLKSDDAIELTIGGEYEGCITNQSIGRYLCEGLDTERLSTLDDSYTLILIPKKEVESE